MQSTFRITISPSANSPAIAKAIAILWVIGSTVARVGHEIVVVVQIGAASRRAFTSLVRWSARGVPMAEVPHTLLQSTLLRLVRRGAQAQAQEQAAGGGGNGGGNGGGA